MANPATEVPLSFGVDLDDFLYPTNEWVCEVISRVTGQSYDDLVQVGYLSAPGRAKVDVFKDVFRVNPTPEDVGDDGFVCGKLLTNTILFEMLLNGQYDRASSELGVQEYKPIPGAKEGLILIKSEVENAVGRLVVPRVSTSRSGIPSHVATVERLVKSDWLDVINFRNRHLVGNSEDSFEQAETKAQLARRLGLIAHFDDAAKYLRDFSEFTLPIKFGEFAWQQATEEDLPYNVVHMSTWSEAPKASQAVVGHCKELLAAA